MTEIDTAAEREAANELIESGEATGQDFADVVPELLDAYDRLRAENQRLKLAALTADRESMELEAENQRLQALIIHDAGGRAVTQGSFNAFMDDYNRFREQRDNARSLRDATIAVANANRQRLTDEIESVLQLMDGLAEQWGDEAVFRRCRDRLRAAVESTGGAND